MLVDHWGLTTHLLLQTPAKTTRKTQNNINTCANTYIRMITMQVHTATHKKQYRHCRMQHSWATASGKPANWCKLHILPSKLQHPTWGKWWRPYLSFVAAFKLAVAPACSTSLPSEPKHKWKGSRRGEQNMHLVLKEELTKRLLIISNQKLRCQPLWCLVIHFVGELGLRTFAISIWILANPFHLS